MCTARGRSSLIPSRVSPRWRATLRAGQSLDGSNPAAREPLRAGESTHLRSQRTPGGYLARGTPTKLTAGGCGKLEDRSRGGGDTFLGPRGGWTGCRACSEPRSDPLGHASTAWVGPPSPCVPCSERTQGSDCRWRALPTSINFSSKVDLLNVDLPRKVHRDDPVQEKAGRARRGWQGN